MKQLTEQERGRFLEDDEIVELYWGRDEEAIRETDRKYGKYLYTIAYHIVHDRSDCEECLNDTYLGTWNRIPPARPSLFRAFLAKIMRNTAVDKFRAKTAEKRVPSELTVSLDELDECVQYRDDGVVSAIASILNDYLRSLTPRAEFIFVCRYYYADRVADIAQMLQMSESTVFRELATIREGLKKRLQEEGYYL
ncbi:MAG: sigma-70 family RNA polymerase sigma factor [Clostridia bacterium]|nr:sigma-70 family RNA polymerase sigma factor [Clostridia bacterium]